MKDELARVEPVCEKCELAELSAIVRVCGTLSFHGSGRYSVSITTETGAVARTLVRLAHKLFHLDTSQTLRRSLLHKSRNYLIELNVQDGLDEALMKMGILIPGRGLVPGIPASLVARKCCLCAYLRGAFLAGGFIADPHGDFHLEMAVTGENYARDIVTLCSQIGVTARINHRRGSYAIYLKSYSDIIRMLRAMGATRSVRDTESAHSFKSIKSDVNRRVNAEIANQARAGGAAAEQLALIEAIEREIGLEGLSPALHEFCVLRRAYPELSLTELGQMHDPPLSKSALYHRVLRLEELYRAHGS